MNYGEILIKGNLKMKFFSSYIVILQWQIMSYQPVVTMALARELLKKKNKYSYIIILIPETIGSICYLRKNLNKLKKNVFAGYNITCVGDENRISYLPSRNGNTLSDKAALNILKYSVNTFEKYTWLDRGSDERQYCWPGIDLPICSIMKSKYTEYPEYHTSLDNMSFISAIGLFESFLIYLEMLKNIEENDKFLSTSIGEPKLDKRGLRSTVSKKREKNSSNTILNFLSYCDGKNDLFDISEILNLSMKEIIDLKKLLSKKKLIKKLKDK